MANRFWGDTMARETQWRVTHVHVLEQRSATLRERKHLIHVHEY